ncbi:unnamed protein product [Brassica rapa subsp. trilocularis]
MICGYIVPAVMSLTSFPNCKADHHLGLFHISRQHLQFGPLHLYNISSFSYLVTGP